jgi:hypothetical protein
MIMSTTGNFLKSMASKLTVTVAEAAATTYVTEKIRKLMGTKDSDKNTPVAGNNE